MRSAAATRCCASSNARCRGRDEFPLPILLQNGERVRVRRRHSTRSCCRPSPQPSPRKTGRGRSGAPWKSARSSAAGCCPTCCSAPQLVVTLVFFYWPASQALWQSFLLQDAFGLRTDFIWFENYRELFRAARLLPRHGDHGALLGGRHGAVALDRAAAGGAGRQEHQRRGRLQDAADLALRRGAGDRRRAVAVHVPALARHRGAWAAIARASTGTRCSTATTP